MKNLLILLTSMAFLLNAGGQTGRINGWRPPPEEKTIQITESIHLSYVEQGNKNRVPIILLHGYTDSYQSFRSLLPFLPDDMHVLAVSLRGHGHSSKPDTGYSPQAMAADVVAFMNKKGIRFAVLAGHSMGSTVALHTAFSIPGRIKGLVLIGAFSNYSQKETLQAFRREVDNLQEPLDTGFVREFQASTVAIALQPAWMNMVVEESLKVPVRVWKGAIEELFNDSNLPGIISTIDCSLLLLWGEQDGLALRNDQEFFLKRVPDSRLRIYPEAGHAPHWELPQIVSGDIENFYKELLKQSNLSVAWPTPGR